MKQLMRKLQAYEPLPSAAISSLGVMGVVAGRIDSKTRTRRISGTYTIICTSASIHMHQLNIQEVSLTPGPLTLELYVQCAFRAGLGSASNLVAALYKTAYYNTLNLQSGMAGYLNFFVKSCQCQ